MQRIIFQNQGEIEAGALTLLGASTKREDESKIGMFGSGNKYALAYLIRNGYDVLIYSGEEHIEIGTQTERLGGEVFDVITVQGQRTSITTSTGPQWTLWQAIRELYSNAIDEGGAEMYFGPEAELQPAQGKTTIVVSHKNSNMLERFWIDQNRYFSWQRSDVIHQNDHGTIFRQPTKTIYRKGIRCIDDNQAQRFMRDYDLPKVNINEERLAKNKHEVQHSIWNIYLTCTSVAVVQTFIEGLSNAYKDGTHRDLYEWNSNLNGSFYVKDTTLNPEVWKKALGSYKVAKERDAEFVSNPTGTLFLPSPLVDHIIAKCGHDYDAVQFRLEGQSSYRKVENDQLVSQILFSKGRLEKKDIIIEAEHIQPVVFSESTRLVSIAQDTLFVSDKMSDYTEEQIDKAMIRVWGVGKGLGREEPDVLLDAFYKYIFKKQ